MTQEAQRILIQKEDLKHRDIQAHYVATRVHSLLCHNLMSKYGSELQRRNRNIISKFRALLGPAYSHYRHDVDIVHTGLAARATPIKIQMSTPRHLSLNSMALE